MANLFLSLLSLAQTFLSEIRIFGKIFYFKEMYTLCRQKINSTCYNESDFVQVHINEHIQTFIPLFGLQCHSNSMTVIPNLNP